MPQIRLIRADNPSPLTGPGTNSYVVGSGDLVVIDPGPDLDSHLDALLAATSGERITDILLTHAHLDHSALIPRLAAATGAATHAFGPAAAGRSPLMRRLAAEGLDGGGEGADPGFRPDHLLRDGAFTLNGLSFEAIHTPGHMGGHLCFALGGVLFSGDHVMGWSTTLISPPDGDMAAYMAALDRLARRDWARFLPGHGDAIDQPAARLTELAAHRRSRESAILAALVSGGPATPAALAARIYSDIPASLLPAAARNVLAHLIDLSSRGAAEPLPGRLAETRFRAL